MQAAIYLQYYGRSREAGSLVRAIASFLKEIYCLALIKALH
jgi:hypothetical protein